MVVQAAAEVRGAGESALDGILTDADIDLVLALPLFRSIDPSRFLRRMPLREVIRTNARIDYYKRGQIIVRKGDYGHSAFVVLEGTVGVAINPPPTITGLKSTSRRSGRSWIAALSQFWRNATVPEVRDVRTYGKFTDWSLHDRDGQGPRPFLSDPDEFFNNYKVTEINEGDMFGEIATLSRTPRNATVIAVTSSKLLELSWIGMREIRRRDEGFRGFIDERYRSRSLKTHLKESPLFKELDDEILSHIAAETQFETYGTFEWTRAYKQQLVSDDFRRSIDEEPAIAQQGDYVDGLIMIRAGFARVSERLGEGYRTLQVATTNDVFGLEEIAEYHKGCGTLTLKRSLHAIGYVDILRVPTALVEEYVLESLDHGAVRTRAPWVATDHALDQALIDFLVDRRFMNGTQAMVIDTQRCVSCDDCVTACAAAHNNNPRFVRHGPEHGKLMVANACMHCRDPVCLIGCPTGAIQRLPEDGRVVIDDPTCIGCGTCVNSCPYSNIRLVEVRDSEGALLIDKLTGKPIVRATKCDLCLDQIGGPACQRACPHDALVRIDIADQAALTRWIAR